MSEPTPPRPGPSGRPALASALTYAGTLPFIACAALAWRDAPVFMFGPTPAEIAVAYGAVIASFVAGTHWAARVYRPEVSPLPTLVMSNVFALLAWLALLPPPQILNLSLLILCFLGLLAVDAMLCRRGVLPTWFWPLRRNATLIVCTMLALIAFALSMPHPDAPAAA